MDEASKMLSDKEHEVNKQIQEQDIPLHTQTKKRVMQKWIKSNNIKHSKLDNALDETVRALRKMSSSSHSSNNEFTLFGQLVAAQLAQLPLEITINLQQKFKNEINEARLEHIRSSSTTISVSSPSTMCLSLNSSECSYKPLSLEPQYEEVSLNAINIEEQPSLCNYNANWEDYTNDNIQ